MRIVWRVIALLCVAHVLAALGLLAWLGATDRLSGERLAAAVELFERSAGDERQADRQAADVDAEAAEYARRVAVLSGHGDDEGAPASIAQRLDDEQRADRITLRRLERARTEVDGLRRNLDMARGRVEERIEAFEQARREFDQRVEQFEQRLNEEGFARAVALHESLPSGQTKQMFIRMIDDDQAEQVVNLLEAMQPRRAGNVLREFRTDQEIGHAVELTRRLRERGTDLRADLEGLE